MSQELCKTFALREESRVMSQEFKKLGPSQSSLSHPSQFEIKVFVDVDGNQIDHKGDSKKNLERYLQ